MCYHLYCSETVENPRALPPIAIPVVDASGISDTGKGRQELQLAHAHVIPDEASKVSTRRCINVYVIMQG